MRNIIVSFGSEGVEGLLSVPSDLVERVFEEKIRGETADASAEISRYSSSLFAMQLRARLNSHRGIEIWAINVDDKSADLFEQSIKHNFNSALIDLIKSKGKKVAY